MQKRRLALAVAAVTLSCWVQGHAQNETPDRLVTPIVAARRTVTNLVHPLATRQNDLGRVNGNRIFHRMVLLLQRSAAQQADLDRLLKEQEDPQSPQYRKWLTPAEFGQRFGPSANDLARITGWLKGQGFSVEKPSNGRQFILFTGSSAQVETAFQTEMHRYGVGGKTYFANSRPASIPAALAPDVRGVSSLTSFGNFKPQSYTAATPGILVGGEGFTGPADLAAIYDAAPLQKSGIEGQGESISIIEESDFDPQDLADFRKLTGLPPADVNVIENGPDPGKLVDDGEEFEAIADVEYAGALDPDATLNVIVSQSTEFNQGIDLSTVYAVDYLVSPIASLSYGGCETLNDTYYNNTVVLYSYAYEQGAAEGISHFISSGDNGGDDCEYTGLSAGYGVNAIGDSPWNVSVGGTEFIMPDPYVYFPPADDYTAQSYIPESTWNDYENPYDGRPLAGNGGASIYYNSVLNPSLGVGKPTWQTGLGVPGDSARDTPDVSLLAGDNLAYLTCEQDIGYDCADGYAGGVLGTSLSAQVWAGIQALVDEKNNLIDGAGNPDPVYYSLANSGNSPFHDITIGDTKVPDPDGQLVGYAATPGFDLATGLGSVDVNKLATEWAPATGSGTATVTLSTGGVTAITHGDRVTAAITVSGNGDTIAGGDVVVMAGAQGVYQATLGPAGSVSIPFGDTAQPLSLQVELPGGSYNLKADYAGDSHFAPAVSNSIAMTVNPEPTTTVAQYTGPPQVAYGTPVVVGAASYGANSGTGFPVAGTYTYSENGATLGTASLAKTGEGYAYTTVQTTASLTLSGSSALAVGTHNIDVSSPPASASFMASTTTAPARVTIVPAQVMVSLTPNHTTPALNSTVSLLATVINEPDPGTPATGTVQFRDLSTSPYTVLGSARLSTAADPSGAYDATLAAKFTTAGVHPLVAFYQGDTNDIGNLSGVTDVTVGGSASSTTTIHPGSGLVFGEYALAGNNLSFLADVSGDSGQATPTGNVTFTDMAANNGAGAPIGTAPLGSSGTAALTTSSLTGGTHFIVAGYPGDNNFAASSSQSIGVVIGDFSFTSGVSTATVAAGQSTGPITLTYTGTSDFTAWLSAAEAPDGSAVQLSCSGLPSGAACSFSSAVITPTDTTGGTTGTATVTISTTGPMLQLGGSQLRGRSQPHRWNGAGSMALAGLLALGIPFAFRRRYFSTLLGVALLAVTAGAGGCGGGAINGYTVTGPGTPAGASAVVVTATINGGELAGTLSHSVTINLTVTAPGGN